MKVTTARLVEEPRLVQRGDGPWVLVLPEGVDSADLAGQLAPLLAAVDVAVAGEAPAVGPGTEPR